MRSANGWYRGESGDGGYASRDRQSSAVDGGRPAKEAADVFVPPSLTSSLTREHRSLPGSESSSAAFACQLWLCADDLSRH